MAALLQETRLELERDLPQIAATIGTAATPGDLEAWHRLVGVELPDELAALYSVYGGTPNLGSYGFSLVGGWRVLPVREAIDAYEFLRPDLDSLGISTTLIPFARDISASFLAVAVDGSGMWCTLEDTPPVHEPGLDIETLLARTLGALRGHDTEWRADRGSGALMWVSLEAEQDHLEGEI